MDIRDPSGEFHREACRFRAYLGSVALRARVGKQRCAAHHEPAFGQRAVNDRCHAQKLALSFFGRDPADAADTGRAARSLGGECRPRHAVVDHFHALPRNKLSPRVRREPARRDHRSIRAA